MAALLIPTLHAEVCEDVVKPNTNCTLLTPVLVCGNYSYDILNETGVIKTGLLTHLNSSVYYFHFSEKVGDYIIRLCDNSTREIYVRGDDEMGSLSITVFVLLVTGFLVWLGFAKKFSENEVLNMVLRRCCWAVSSVLMAYNSGIMAVIADSAGLDVTTEMFRYMWFFGWACYLLAAFLVVSMFFTGTRMWKLKRESERMGETGW